MSIKAYWDEIPEGTDVLITHGPPYGTLDLVPCSRIPAHVGCKDLLDAIKRVNPKIWIGGHIHFSYGIDVLYHNNENKTTLYNASLLDEDYKLVNSPHIVDV